MESIDVKKTKIKDEQNPENINLWYFPGANKAIEANSLEEAMEKYNKLKVKKD